MSDFKNKSITTKGLELLSKAMVGGKLEFTRLEMGSGTFSGDISNAENLVEVKQNLTITNIVRKGGQVTLSAILKVEDITTEYDWTEIGVYAKGADEVEVLYMYGYTTSTSFISKDSLNEKLINVTVIVSNAANVTALIDGSIAYLTTEALEDHNTSEKAHSDIRELIKEVKMQVENIDVSWEGITGKPSEFPPSSHTHDDMYYTETEIDTKLNDKLTRLIEMPHNQSLNQDLHMGNYHFFNVTDGYPSGYASGDNDFILQIVSSGVTNTRWQTQLLTDIRSGKVFKRAKLNNSYDNWQSINDGGNADTLDGKHASEFSPNNHTHSILTGGQNAVINIGTGKDTAGLSTTNNVDIKSWYGVSFSNSCPNAGIIGRPTASIDVRSGTLYLENDVYVGGTSLKQSVVNGKQEVVNAINDKLGYASGLTTSHPFSDYGWWIRNKITNGKTLISQMSFACATVDNNTDNYNSYERETFNTGFENSHINRTVPGMYVIEYNLNVIETSTSYNRNPEYLHVTINNNISLSNGDGNATFVVFANTNVCVGSGDTQLMRDIASKIKVEWRMGYSNYFRYAPIITVKYYHIDVSKFLQ